MYMSVIVVNTYWNILHQCLMNGKIDNSYISMIIYLNASLFIQKYKYNRRIFDKLLKKFLQFMLSGAGTGYTSGAPGVKAPVFSGVRVARFSFLCSVFISVFVYLSFFCW